MDQVDLNNLYETRDLADCSFVFPNENGKIIQGHSVILATQSPVFRSMFMNLKETGSRYIINILDESTSTFESLLRFIYCKELSANEQDLKLLYQALHKYDCKNAKNHIIKKLMDEERDSKLYRSLLEMANEINDDLLFETYVEKLFMPSIYDPEVLNFAPELLKKALLYLIENEEITAHKVLVILRQYMRKNENSDTNFNETFSSILKSIKWDTVHFMEIIQNPILKVSQKIEFLKRNFQAIDSECENGTEKANDSESECDVEKKTIGESYKRRYQEMLIDEVAASIVQLYNEEERSDCDFMFPNGEILKAHKFVLCYSSPIFVAMFYGTGAQTNSVEIKDTEKSTFELLLKIIYLQDVDLSSESSETLADLYAVAHKYQCMTALDFVGEYMAVRSEDAFLFYSLSEIYDDKELKKTCLKHLENPLIALKTNHFLNSDPETVCLVYQANKVVDSSGMISLVKGLELFIAKNESKWEDVMFKVQEALKGIRFMELKTVEILETSLLSDREKLIFFTIKQDCKMLIPPPTILDVERLSAYDCEIIKGAWNRN